MFELKFDLKLTKLVFSYILMFYLKKKEKIDGKKFLAHPIHSTNSARIDEIVYFEDKNHKRTPFAPF